MQGFIARREGKQGFFSISERKRIIWGPGCLFFEGREGKGFCCVDCLFFIWGMERALQHITLPVLDWKIPD